MGGSGGYGYSFSRSDEDSNESEHLDESLEHTRQKSAEAESAEVFSEVLGEINQQDTETINRHKDSVLKTLKDTFPDAVDLHGGGSYTRHTYVNGLSDIDVLLDLGTFSSSTVANKDDSQSVLSDMKQQLRQRFPGTEITTGRMAATIRFSDGTELQVLPAFRYHNGYRIPDPQGSGWIVTRPRVFGDLLRQRNAEVDGKLLPTIKLARRICDNQRVEVKPYHLENMAVRAFEGYTGDKTYQAMLSHLFNRAKALTVSPMKDITGQSTHVDGYLLNRASRVAMGRRLADIERQIAEAGETPGEWKRLLQVHHE